MGAHIDGLKHHRKAGCMVERRRQDRNAASLHTPETGLQQAGFGQARSAGQDQFWATRGASRRHAPGGWRGDVGQVGLIV